MKKIGIFVSPTCTDSNLISSVHSFLSKTPENNVFVFTDAVLPQSMPDIATVNSYLMDWSKCDVVFMNTYDYDKYKHKAVQKYFLTHKHMLPRLNKELVKNCQILIIDDKLKIRKAKNAELQCFK